METISETDIMICCVVEKEYDYICFNFIIQYNDKIELV